jgi:hypothetical protein
VPCAVLLLDGLVDAVELEEVVSVLEVGYVDEAEVRSDVLGWLEVEAVVEPDWPVWLFWP